MDSVNLENADKIYEEPSKADLQFNMEDEYNQKYNMQLCLEEKKLPSDDENKNQNLKRTSDLIATPILKTQPVPQTSAQKSEPVPQEVEASPI